MNKLGLAELIVKQYYTRVSSHFFTQKVQGFYTLTLLHPEIFADISAEFYLNRGLKPLPIAYSLLPLPLNQIEIFEANSSRVAHSLSISLKDVKEMNNPSISFQADSWN